jgi:hypothetical protein
VKDEWAAYQFDAAVTMIGIAIENAVQEMHNIGSEESPQMEPKYKLAELLDKNFRLPLTEEDDIGSLMVTGAEGIQYQEVK